MKVLDWQSPVKIGDVEVPVLVGREDGGYKDKVVVPIYGWTIPRLPGSKTGHGHVWARPDAVVEDCGGPEGCAECQADARLVAEMLDSITEAGAAFRVTEPRIAIQPVDDAGRDYLERVHRVA